MDIQTYLPIIVVLGVAGFLLGNVFALKPKAHEVRSADFRLLARQFGFNPKLVARPDWLPAKAQRHNHHATKTDLVAVYGVVNDDWRLPMGRLIYQENVWRAVDDTAVDLSVLDCLPTPISVHAVGLQYKANSVVLYWLDVRYQGDRGVQKLDQTLAKADLSALQQALMAIGDAINARK